MFMQINILSKCKYLSCTKIQHRLFQRKLIDIVLLSLVHTKGLIEITNFQE